jgi:hypothetical protein
MRSLDSLIVVSSPACQTTMNSVMTMIQAIPAMARTEEHAEARTGGIAEHLRLLLLATSDVGTAGLPETQATNQTNQTRGTTPKRGTITNTMSGTANSSPNTLSISSPYAPISTTIPEQSQIISNYCTMCRGSWKSFTQSIGGRQKRSEGWPVVQVQPAATPQHITACHFLI